MHTVTEAEQLIIAEWRAWSSQRGSYSSYDMQIFWGWLQQNKSYLLSFRCSDDKWQRVRGWLQNYEDIQSKLRNLGA
jgi:hypothetical protein